MTSVIDNTALQFQVAQWHRMKWSEAMSKISHFDSFIQISEIQNEEQTSHYICVISVHFHVAVFHMLNIAHSITFFQFAIVWVCCAVVSSAEGYILSALCWVVRICICLRLPLLLHRWSISREDLLQKSKDKQPGSSCRRLILGLHSTLLYFLSFLISMPCWCSSISVFFFLRVCTDTLFVLH